MTTWRLPPLAALYSSFPRLRKKAPSMAQKIVENRSDYRGLRFRLIFDGDDPPGVFRIPRGTLVKPKHQRLITAEARAEGIDDVEKFDEEVNKGTQISVDNSDSEHQQSESVAEKGYLWAWHRSFCWRRSVSGGWVFTMALAAAVFVGAREYLSW